MFLEYSSLLIILAITAFHKEGISAVPQVAGKFLYFFIILLGSTRPFWHG
jgi:hypothetical protein